MRSSTLVSSSDLALAKEFAHRLAEHYDPALCQMTLVGLRAQGDTDEESTLNLFATL